MDIYAVDGLATLRRAMRSTPEGIKSHGNVVELPIGPQALRDRKAFAAAIAELRQRCPLVSIVVLATREDWDAFAKMLETTIRNSVPKSVNDKLILSALQIGFAGDTGVAADHRGQARRAAQAAGDITLAPETRAPSAEAALTKRQAEVLALMAQGKSNKSICCILGVAEPTVKNHVTAILRALKVSNRTEAVIAAKTLGLALPMPKPTPSPARSRQR